MIFRRVTALIGALASLTAAAPAAAAPLPAGFAEVGVPAGPDGGTISPFEPDGGTIAPIEQTGGTVLFDQLTGGGPDGVGTGLPIQRWDIAALLDAEGADDFQVFDAAGWTISEVVFGTPFFGFRADGGVVDVRVYPDAGGSPGDSALCSYDAIQGVQHGTMQARVPLPEPCRLGPGRYWLWLQPVEEQFRWAVGFHNPGPPGFNLGEPAHWRNPPDGWGTGCTDWSDVTDCLLVDGEPVTDTPSSTALFQVCGAVGIAAESFAGCGNENAEADVTVTLAVDNGDPEQCGTATTLDAEQGDLVNVCYTLTNTGNATLAFHRLADNVTFRPLADNVNVAPGQSVRFHRLITVNSSRTIDVESQSTDELPWYFGQLPEDFTFIDIAGTGTPLDLGDDGSANVTMPFRFDVFGVQSDQVCINNNGFLLLDWDRPCDGFHQDLSIPNESVPMRTNQIAPYWDDLFTGGNVYHAVVGEAPNRRFVVQWDEKNHYNNGASDPGGVTFEVILDEATQNVSFQYLDTTFDNPAHPEWDHGGHATIGFQGQVRDGFGGPWRSEPFHTPVLEPELAMVWRPLRHFHATANASATINVATPAITGVPEALEATVEQRGTASLPLTIGNAGDRDLVWSVGEAPVAASQLPAAPALTAVEAGAEPDAEIDAFGVAPGQKPVRVDVPDAGTQDLASFATRGFATILEDLTPPFGPRFHRINDLANPADTGEVASLIGRDIFAGEFVGDDFGRYFGIDECCRQLLTIDTETGEPTIGRGQIVGSEQVVLWLGLAWDATTETLFAVGSDTFSALPDTRFFLARLDLGGHEVVATTIGELPGLAQLTSPIEIAIDPTGRMFAVDIQGNLLWAIDKQTAEAAPVGPLGFNATGSNGLDFDDATGTLYLASLDADSAIGNLYTVDTLTGAATNLGQLGQGHQHMALAIEAGPPCVPPTEVSWLTVSPAEGTTAPDGTDEVTVGVDATGLEVGTHEAVVCVGSNDPATPLVQVPVTVTVTEGDGPVACDETITGVHVGALTVTEGVTCLAAGSRVLGEVNVSQGAGLVATAAVVQGPISAIGATTVDIVFSQVTGPVVVVGATGEVTLFASQVTGSVSLFTNRTTDASAVSGNTVIGALSCFGNSPVPTNHGLPNTATGGKLGQCAEL